MKHSEHSIRARKSATSFFLIAMSSALVFGCGVKENPKAQSNTVSNADHAIADHAIVDSNSTTTAGATSTGATRAGDGASPKLLKMPTEQFGPMDVTPAKQENKSADTAADQPAEAAKNKTPENKTPEAVTVLAHATEPLKVSPTSGGNEKIISTLSGKIAIDKIEPDIQNATLGFAGATDVKIVSPDLGKCELLAKNFTTVDAEKILAFTLMGMDDKSEPSPDGCLVKLSTLAMTGFTVEFKDVHLGGPLSEVVVPTVRLTVEPAKSN